jgi:hypothetical protein
MRKVIAFSALFVLAACNLSSDQPGGLITSPSEAETDALTTLIPMTEEAQQETLTSLPGIVLTPNTSANRNPATRTPFGTLNTQTAPTLNAVVTALPTSPTGESATITSPAQGANITPGTIQISGTVYNLPADQFTLSIVAPDNTPLNTQTITLRNPNQVASVPWSAAVQVTRYTGPAQIRVVARTAEDREMTLAAVDIVIGQNTTPGGTNPTSAGVRSASSPTGTIDSPTNGETVTGDPVMITGTAGGFPGGTFTLELLAADGTSLGSIPITLTGSDTAAVPWAAPVSTGGYHGQATIRAVVTVDGSEVVLASVNVTLG